MKIAALPLETIHADVHANLISAAERLRHVSPDTDLAILPETFTTGYISDPEVLRQVAETNDGHTVTDVRRWALHFHMAIAGSFVATNQARTKFYNRAFIIEPGGDATFYDKHHLFSLSGESHIFTPGTELPPVIRYMGCNIALAVCYDLRFPEWLRNSATGPRSYDLLVLPAEWPLKRIVAWNTLIKARAIENQAFVAGVNRSGSHAGEDYDVTSTMIVDYMGNVLASGTSTMPIEATLDLEGMRRQRRALQALADRTPFTFLPPA